MHPFLQPQRSSCRQACVASERVVLHIFQPPYSFLFHPHSLGDGSSGVAIINASTSPNCGLPLVLERTFAIYRPTRWPTYWVLIVVLLCQCFMPSLVVTRCHVFRGRSKRTAWDIWSAYDEVTPAFCALGATPESVENWLGPLE